MDIGKRLRRLRTAKGLSQGDIERRCGLMRSYVSRVEGGFTVPSLATLEKWAKALEVKPYQLLFQGKGRPVPLRSPDQTGLSRPVRALVKLFEGLPSASRKWLLALAVKLAGR